MGVSRASVSLALHDLSETGLTLQRVHGRGYRLLDPMQWLERDAILRYLGREANNFNLEVLDIVDSTSTYLLQRAARGSGAGDERFMWWPRNCRRVDVDGAGDIGTRDWGTVLPFRCCGGFSMVRACCRV